MGAIVIPNVIDLEFSLLLKNGCFDTFGYCSSCDQLKQEKAAIFITEFEENSYFKEAEFSRCLNGFNMFLKFTRKEFCNQAAYTFVYSLSVRTTLHDDVTKQVMDDDIINSIQYLFWKKNAIEIVFL